MAKAFKPINAGGFQRYPFNTHKEFVVTDSDYRNSFEISILKAITPLFNQKVEVSKSIDGQIIRDTTELDNSNSNNSGSLSSVHQKIVWSSVNYNFYGTRGVMERNLFSSASIFSIPHHRMGDGIKPGSVSILDNSVVSSPLNLSDKKIDEYHGEIIHNALVTSSYTPISELIGYWGFNEEVVSRFASIDEKIDDKSGYLNHGFGKDITFSKGIKTSGARQIESGTKVEFNGSSSYIRVDHNSEFNFVKGNNYAISLWSILPPSQSDASSDYNWLINKNGTFRDYTSDPLTGAVLRRRNLETPIYPFEIKIQNHNTIYNGQLAIAMSDGITTTEITSSTLINDANAHHIVFNKNGSNLELWIDGNKESETSINALSQVHNEYDVLFGSKFLSDSGFDITSNFKTLSGSLDEIRFYRRALTSDEIGSLSNNDFVTGSAYQTNVVGEVFYKHGLIVISDPRPAYHNVLVGASGSWNYGANRGFTTKYKSTKELHEVSLLCNIGSNEFNVSQNVSLRENDDINSSILKGFVTGSDFKPYFTTIGLYNDAGELLAIGKMGSATQVRNDVDITVKVRFDIDGPFGSPKNAELPEDEQISTLTQNADGNFVWNKK